MKQNWTYQLLVYTDYVNLVDEGMSTMTKNTEAVVDTQQEVGLKLNTEETMYMFLIHELNTR